MHLDFLQSTQLWISLGISIVAGLLIYQLRRASQSSQRLNAIENCGLSQTNAPRFMNVSTHREKAHCGISAALTSIASSVRAGGMLVDVIQEHNTYNFATRDLTIERVHSVVSYCAQYSQQRYVPRISAQLFAACMLSNTLGCGAADCVETVAEEYKRLNDVENRQKAALAMPRMTLRVLLMLPLLIIAIEQVCNSQSLVTLFATSIGWFCLIITGILYAVGFVWVRAIMSNFSQKCGSNR